MSFSNIFYDYKTGKIHLWEYLNGAREHVEEEYKPYCYLYDNNGEFRDINGKKCKKKEFETWSNQKNYVEKYTNRTLEGDISPEDRFLIDRYAHIPEITDFPIFNIHYIDIECKADKGFPSATNIDNEITLISIYSTVTKKIYVFGAYDYTPTDKFVEYIWCEDEMDLLKKYFRWHKENMPDVITGWNCEGFDIPYILNRGKYIISETFTNRYSPINIVRDNRNGGYDIAGISVLDYLNLYKQFAINQRESYSLDYISNTELGEGKVKFDGSLNELMTKDWKRYVEYNIKDVMLVKRLEDKLGYIKLVQGQSYACRVPLKRYGSSIRKFDNYLMSLLKPKKLVVPTAMRHEMSSIPGGYVSEPQVGYFKHVVGYDFTSLYPHIIMALNISPDSYIGTLDGNHTEFDIYKIEENKHYHLEGKEVLGSKLKELILSKNLLVSPCGTLYKPAAAFIPTIIHDLFEKRKQYKKQMQEAERKYQETKEEKYKLQASTYDTFQYSTKILLNSAYGIMANAQYRFFNLNNAKSVTLMGQKVVKYTAEIINDYFTKNFGIKDIVSIYSDTDSIYVNFDGVLKWAKDKNIIVKTDGDFIKFVNSFTNNYLSKYLEEKLLDFCKVHGIKRNFFDLKREAIATGSIFIQKKKYALNVIDSEGTTYEKAKIKIKGMEIVRSSTPSFCRDKIKEVVAEIFKNNNLEYIVNMLRGIKKDFKSVPIETIAFPRGVSGMSEYILKDNSLKKGTPIHVRAANNYNKLLEKKNLTNKYEKIHDGDKIKFIYLNPENILKENIIAFKDVLPKEFELEKSIDYETQFEKSFLSPINTLADAMGWVISLDTEDMASLF